MFSFYATSTKGNKKQIAKEVLIEFQNITKNFGDVVANNISLQVYQGEILSVLGENGCGKTTLMKMFTGIFYPDALLDGLHSGAKSVRRK